MAVGCGSSNDAASGQGGPYALVFNGSAPTGETSHLFAASGQVWDVRQLSAQFDDLPGPVWSPDFKYAATPSGTVLRVRDGKRHEIEDGLSFAYPWSPDGSKLVFVEDESLSDDEDGTVFVASADGTHRRPVARGWLAGWAPDGRIYIQQGQTIATTAIKAVDPVSGKVETITSDEDVVDWLLGGAWSPDGRFVAFTGIDDDLRLFEIGASHPPTLLVPPRVGAFSWAPGGERIAVATATAGDSWNLRIIERDSVEVLQGIGGQDISWSPDGEWLALTLQYGYDSGRNTLSDIWVVRADGTDLHQVTSGKSTQTSYRSPSWVPEPVLRIP